MKLDFQRRHCCNDPLSLGPWDVLKPGFDHGAIDLAAIAPHHLRGPYPTGV